MYKAFPLLLSALLIAALLFQSSQSDYFLTLRQKLAVAGVSISAIAGFIHPKSGRFLLLLTLLSGAFSLTHFFYEQESHAFFINGPWGRFNTPSVNYWVSGILVVHILLNRHDLIDYRHKLEKWMYHGLERNEQG